MNSDTIACLLNDHPPPLTTEPTGPSGPDPSLERRGARPSPGPGSTDACQPPEPTLEIGVVEGYRAMPEGVFKHAKKHGDTDFWLTSQPCGVVAHCSDERGANWSVYQQ